MTTLHDIYDTEIELTTQEEELLIAVKTLFSSKPDYAGGDRFREAFVREAMDGYCMHCGAPEPCYCRRDD